MTLPKLKNILSKKKTTPRTINRQPRPSRAVPILALSFIVLVVATVGYVGARSRSRVATVEMTLFGAHGVRCWSEWNSWQRAAQRWLWYRLYVL